MKKIKVFMNKFDGEIALSYSSNSLWFEDESTSSLSNTYILVGYL